MRFLKNCGCNGTHCTHPNYAPANDKHKVLHGNYSTKKHHVLHKASHNFCVNVLDINKYSQPSKTTNCINELQKFNTILLIIRYADIPLTIKNNKKTLIMKILMIFFKKNL